MCADAPHKDTLNCEGKNTNPKQQQPEIPPTLRAEFQIPQSVINTYQSDQKKKYGLERWKFFVEILTLLAITVYAIITYCQWTTMREATEATKISATAAKDAVRVAKDALDMQKKSVDNTLLEMKAQSKAMQIAANSAKKSADVAEKTMIGTQRPWVSVRLALGSGLKFDEQGGNITIVFRMKNVGNSPAVGTHIDAKVVLGFGPKDAIVEQKTMLAAARKYGPPFSASSVGYMLFPGEEFTYRINFSISREYIKKSQTEIAESFKRGNPDIPNIANSFNGITPSIVGCVVYGFSFDESVHKTGFLGEVFRIDPLHPSGRYIIDPAAGDVPSNLLILAPSEFGSYAD